MMAERQVFASSNRAVILSGTQVAERLSETEIQETRFTKSRVRGIPPAAETPQVVREV